MHYLYIMMNKIINHVCSKKYLYGTAQPAATLGISM